MNQRRANGSIHDQPATGRKPRVLTMVDIWSRFSPAVDPRFSYRAGDVVAALDRVCAEAGFPKTIRVIRAASSSPAIPTSGPACTV